LEQDSIDDEGVAAAFAAELAREVDIDRTSACRRGSRHEHELDGSST
jgi:hypothetical protein